MKLLLKVIAAAGVLNICSLAQKPKEPVDYVNPHIGGYGHLLSGTLPTVQLPYGMVRLIPRTLPAGAIHYIADKILGFPAGGLDLMPTTVQPGPDPASYASEFDRDFEVVTPYYSLQLLGKYDIQVEYTVARRAAFYRFTFPEARSANVLAAVGQQGEVTAIRPDALGGFSASGRDGRTYFYALFSHPVADSRTWRAAPGAERRGRLAGPERGLALTFTGVPNNRLDVRIGVSYISVDYARRNLMEDIPEADFDQATYKARAIWNRELSKIAIDGGTEEERTVFYTALYRSLGRMNDITEAGGHFYSGYDKKVHSADGHAFYVNDNLWDTHRTLHPLQLLLDPQRQVDMVRSYLRMYDQSGWLPTAPSLTGDRGVMIGHHAAPFILDTYIKGYRDFDAEKAYHGMRNNAMEATMVPWRRGPATALDRIYHEKGFFPALGKGEKETVELVDSFERRQAVAVTLEHAYDDWAVAQMAKALGKTNDYAYFMKRARNYANLYDNRIGFMAPKTEDGNWKYSDPTEFDPKRGGGLGGRDYFAECNGWVYQFHVQHDLPGLIELMGGKENFAAKLDALFSEQYGVSRWVFMGQFPDMTGLIGNYSQGNQPAFHVPYLYNYAGQPWKTQFRVRQIMKVWFWNGLLGLPGMDDGGSLSSWYVWSAMGLYPVCPGRPVYDIGSPLFREVRIALTNEKTFTIKARDVSPRNKYIQSAQLNGKPLNSPWLQHSDVAGGGELVLEMGPKPNTSWGSAPATLPGN